MSNWLALHEVAIRWTFRVLEQARGVYRRRLLSSLNPIHWVMMFLTLPMQAVKWIGGNPDGSLSRAITVTYWIAGAIALVLGLLGKNLLDLFGS